MGGYTAQKYRWEGSGIRGEEFATDDFGWLNQAKNITLVPGNTPEEWSLLSIISRFNYSFKEKYLFSASYRRDGCSRFGQENKWGDFPSVSLGWVVTQEPFMKEINSVSFLKLRSSYGLTGNYNIGNYTYYASLSPSNYPLNNQITSGFSLSGLENQKLTWEISAMLNIGVDIGFWDDKLVLISTIGTGIPTICYLVCLFLFLQVFLLSCLMLEK
ncbi:MAG: TonB-dependent receptor [Bacteroidales bacterium]|nr:TonB-dependent receptor [Bacteroidales bacterium]